MAFLARTDSGKGSGSLAAEAEAPAELLARPQPVLVPPTSCTAAALPRSAGEGDAADADRCVRSEGSGDGSASCASNSASCSAKEMAKLMTSRAVGLLAYVCEESGASDQSEVWCRGGWGSRGPGFDAMVAPAAARPKSRPRSPPHRRAKGEAQLTCGRRQGTRQAFFHLARRRRPSCC